MDEDENTHPVAPDDDPHSELNVLRRELRQLQASVRDAALQIASQQDEIIDLRKSVAAAELEVEEGLVRESNLRMQLDLQTIKKQQVESTMAAAEALVSSLREMMVEGEGGAGGGGGAADVVTGEVASYPTSPLGKKKVIAQSSASKLDQVLNSIGEDSSPRTPRAQAPSEDPVPADLSPAAASPEISVRTDETFAEHSHQTQNELEGDSTSAPIAKRSSNEMRTNPAPAASASMPQGINEPLSPDIKSPRQAAPRVSSPPIPQPKPRQASKLLRDAFGMGSTAVDSQAQNIHSSNVQSGSPLPTEVAGVAKSEGVPRRTTLPSSITHAVSDAHSGEIFSLATTPDCEWTVSGGDDKMVKVYDSHGAVYATITENTRAVTALGLQLESSGQNSDGVVIYCGGSDGSIRAFRRNVRRKNKWNLEAVLPVHSQAVRRILVMDEKGMSGNSNMILTCSTDRGIRLCDVEHGRKPFSVNTTSAVMDVDCFGAKAGGVIVSGHKDGALRMWSRRDGNGIVGGAKVHSKGVTSVSCLEDGQSIISLGRDNVIRLSDIRMNIAIVREMQGMVGTVSDWHRAGVYGRHVACGLGRQGGLRVWNVDSGAGVQWMSGNKSEGYDDVLEFVASKLRQPGGVVVPVWSASGRFVCAHRSRQVSFWDWTGV